MIDAKDIEIYLKAKKQVKKSRKITFLCLFAICALIVLRAYGVDGLYIDGATIGVFVAGLSHASVASSGDSSHVSQSALLEVLERVINKDSNALNYLADKNVE